jgi:glutamyl-tRNA(Gln) amidotransferase subunit D
MSDQEVTMHYPTRVRKLHTSRRDAFKSVTQEPAALIRGGEIILCDPPPPGRGNMKSFKPKTEFSDDVALLKSYPGMKTEMIETLKVKGLILEGTGLGHVPSVIIPTLKRMVKNGVFVGMTSQCIWGRVSMTVYETGRELVDAGVVPLEDMLAETALAKLSWALANSSSPDEVKHLMVTRLSGEMSDRSAVAG